MTEIKNEVWMWSLQWLNRAKSDLEGVIGFIHTTYFHVLPQQLAISLRFMLCCDGNVMLLAIKVGFHGSTHGTIQGR